MTDPRPAAPQPSLGQLLMQVLFGETSPEEARRDRDRQPVDWWIVLCVLALTFFGLVMVFSASAIEAVEDTGSPYYYLVRQSIAAAIGFTGLVVFARVPSHRLRRLGWVLYFACLAGLMAVFVPGLGHEANGAIRWVGVGSLRLQPSEFMKLALILVLAERVARYSGGITDLKRHVLPLIIIALFPMGLVLAEPDFGTTVILAGIVGLVLYLGGIPTRWMATIAGIGAVVAIPLVLANPYRLGRVLSWLQPWANEASGGYQVIMGWVALHYGGLWGQGLGEAMSSMKWLPFAHTDFVAAVAGEELGFVRMAGVFAIYGILIWRGVVVATRSRSYFGTLIAGCITLILGLQTLFNLGVILGLVPPKGLVLPFMSYGASALIAHLWCVGVLLTVSAEPDEEAVAAMEGRGVGGGRLVPAEGAIGGGLARWGELARAWVARRSTT